MHALTTTEFLASRPSEQTVVLVDTPNDGQLWLLRNDYLSQRICQPAEYEYVVRRLFDDVIGPGEVALDLGAHFGFHTRYLARLVGLGGRVFAFEPDPLNTTILRRNTRHYPQIMVIPVAVGSQSSVAALHRFHSVDSGLSSLGPARMPISDALVPSDEVLVPVMPADAVIPSIAPRRVSLIKIDTEGQTAAVLDGAAEVVARHQPHIVFECGDFPHIDDRTGPVIDQLMTIGYSVPVPHAARRPDGSFRHGNLVACPAACRIPHQISTLAAEHWGD